ncbi:hypothetical protein Tco_0408553 [Tanacetum coccineum]
MAALESCPKHNMIAYLEKTEGNVEFHEVIDFLRRSYVSHALTVSPVVSTTFVEQFWTSAKSKTINNVRHITAKVAGKVVSISEASIRTDLIFDDADGIDTLTNQAIFVTIQRIETGLSDEQSYPHIAPPLSEVQKSHCLTQHCPTHSEEPFGATTRTLRTQTFTKSFTQTSHNLHPILYQTKEELATQASQTSTQTPTSMIFGDDETIATLLLNMSKAKAVSKEKEKEIQKLESDDELRQEKFKKNRKLKRRELDWLKEEATRKLYKNFDYKGKN